MEMSHDSWSMGFREKSGAGDLDLGVIGVVLDKIIWGQCVDRGEKGSQGHSGEHINFRVKQRRRTQQRSRRRRGLKQEGKLESTVLRSLEK